VSPAEAAALNDSDLRMKVAQACGFTFGRTNDDAEQCWRKGGRWVAIPDYAGDLNAMREAENTALLNRQQWDDYEETLRTVMGKSPWEGEPYLFSATARQRAEAFLLTMQ
jgi:hypothetical protein